MPDELVVPGFPGGPRAAIISRIKHSLIIFTAVSIYC